VQITQNYPARLKEASAKLTDGEVIQCPLEFCSGVQELEKVRCFYVFFVLAIFNSILYLYCSLIVF